MKNLFALLSITIMMLFAQVNTASAISMAAIKPANTTVVAAKEASSTSVVKAEKGAISKGLYILLAIIGLGFVGVGMNTDWKGSDWIITLILSCLLWLPGLIYALIKMKNYY